MLRMVERILGWNVPEETNGQEGEMWFDDREIFFLLWVFDPLKGRSDVLP